MKTGIKAATLTQVLSKMLGTKIIDVDFQTEQLHGGTVGNVQLVTDHAKTTDGGSLPYNIVVKTQTAYSTVLKSCLSCCVTGVFGLQTYSTQTVKPYSSIGILPGGAI